MADQPLVVGAPVHATGRAWLAPTLLLALYVLVMSPWLPALIEYSTLDGSWQAVVADAAFQPVQFGRDLVYTVGPYGWLRTGVYWQGLHWAILLWSLFASSVLAWVFSVITRDLRSRQVWASALLFAVFPLLASGRVINMLYLIDCLILFTPMMMSREDDRILAALACPFLALSSLVFFPQMVAASGTMVFFTLVFFARFRRLSWVLPAYTVSCLFWWLVARQSLATIPAFLRTSIEQTRGYADVMSNNGPFIEVVVIITLALAVEALVVLSRRGRRVWVTAFLAVGLAFLFFLTFKHAVVRHQSGRLILPGLAILGAAVAQLIWLARSEAERWRRWKTPTTAIAIAVLIATVVMTGRHHSSGMGSGYLRRLALPLWQTQRLARVVGNPGILAAWDNQRRTETRSDFPLPSITGSVDYFGDRQGIAIAHQLDYRPRPLFQRMTANTPILDAMNRRHYESDSAPETVIIDLTGFGEILRPQLDPAVFLNILENYQPINSKNKLAVVTRGSPKPFKREKIVEVVTPVGTPVSIVPYSSKGPIWLEVDARLNRRGKILGFLYKTPALAIELSFRKGENSTYRFAANAARSGFWLSPTIQNSRQFVRYMDTGFRGVGRNRVVTHLRIFDPSADPSRVWEEIEIRAYRLVRGDDHG